MNMYQGLQVPSSLCSGGQPFRLTLLSILGKIQTDEGSFCYPSNRGTAAKALVFS